MEPELEALVLQHKHLAKSIAYKIWKQAPHSLDQDELRSIALLGLVSAAVRWPSYCESNNFDPGKHEYFGTFASRRMNGAIYDSLRAADWATRSQRTKFKLLQEAGNGKTGVTEDDLVERTGLTSTEIRATLAGMNKKPTGIEAAYAKETEQDVESSFSEKTILQVVVKTIKSLTDPQQCVLALHYFANKELQEIAVMMSITESRASHLHTDAVLVVHQAMREFFEEIQPRKKADV